MFVHIDSVNILTALLLQHGVTQAVVCPGSRNAPIVHNLNACGKMRCWPVTDERSAGYFALGMALAKRQPVVVCVTSGTALLNLAPAVAEAFYQHVPLIVVSADRPEAWIGQLDGQTLPQQGVFGSLVAKTVSLPLHADGKTERWHCNRLVNEALLATIYPVPRPVQINVPIEEPLFRFDVAQLPKERMMHCMAPAAVELGREVVRRLETASRPMVVVGQYWCDQQRLGMSGCRRAVDYLQQQSVWLSERLNNLSDHTWHVDEAVAAIGDDDAYLPDLIVYMGETVVSKRLKAFLRRAADADVMLVAPDGEVKDVTTHLSQVVVASVEDVLQAALERADEKERQEMTTVSTDKGKEKENGENMAVRAAFRDRWQKVLQASQQLADEYLPTFSQMAVVRYLEEQLADMESEVTVHYANSSAIRLANIYAFQPVWCNRGVNGIDGSLSTAVGFAATVDDMVLCVTGDLSFFYDQNALWNQNLGGNLRIVLLNNGQGGIFATLPGLDASEALHRFVGAAHHTSARGICLQNDIGYLSASDMEETRMGMMRLLTETTRRPMLLEVFTDAKADNAALRDYYDRVMKLHYPHQV